MWIRLIAVTGLVMGMGAPLLAHAQHREGEPGRNLYAAVAISSATAGTGDDALHDAFGRGRSDSGFHQHPGSGARLCQELRRARGCGLHGELRYAFSN